MDHGLRQAPEKKCETVPKNKNYSEKRARGMAQVARFLPRNSKAPSSNPSTAKKNDKRTIKFYIHT
jgi:hypothetical protein